jgi:hypothetical protein
METGSQSTAYPNHRGYFDGLLWSGTKEKEKKQEEKNDCGIL